MSWLPGSPDKYKERSHNGADAGPKCKSEKVPPNADVVAKVWLVKHDNLEWEPALSAGKSRVTYRIGPCCMSRDLRDLVTHIV